MNRFSVNSEGYIVNWLVCGPSVTEPHTDIRDSNQLRFEKKVRQEIADDTITRIPEEIACGKPGVNGMAWRYWPAGNNWFIDGSSFYALLRKLEMWAYCEIIAPRACQIPATVWTYTAADVFVNDEKALTHTPPQYKPMKNEKLMLCLKEGVNRVFVRLQSLGARDTRMIFGLRLNETHPEIFVQLPDPENKLDEVIRADGWLNALVCRGGEILASMEPPAPVKICLGKDEEIEWKTGARFAIPENAERFEVRASLNGYELKRVLECCEHIMPAKISWEDDETRHRRIYEAVAGRYGTLNVLARFSLGEHDAEDDEIILRELNHVDTHADCSDFTLNALIRLFRKFPDQTEENKRRFREVALNYRYWMDEDGADAMCFWSENHSLLFFGNQLLAGEMFPDETFLRSGHTGREVQALGAEKCRQWLSSVGTLGFEEFLSSGYMCVTTGALLNLIDFGPKDISDSARKTLDRLIRQHALHAFDGSMIGPEGRVYRDVIAPFRQGVQALLDYAMPGQRNGYSAWMAAFATSSYRFPEDLSEYASQDRDEEYDCGNARIRLFKNRDYILTSCQSPREGNGGWTNEAYETRDPDTTGEFCFDYVKALNERFHGTTRIEPGVFGYQQHLMYAALSAKCVSFVNHPGGTHDLTQMRPGYWFGNGRMPAIRQNRNVLGLVYSLREHPIPFTHVYWPKSAFDECEERGAWLFGRKGNGWMALWTSGKREAFQDMLTDCEYRVYEAESAYVYEMGSAAQDGSFEAFMNRVSATSPVFDAKTRRLTYLEKIDMTFVPHENLSQYVY